MPSPNFEWDVIAAGRKGPGPRSRHGLVYDRAVGATVLFGGIVWAGDGELRSDTWILKDGGWRRDRGTPAPPARHRGAMVFDARRGFTVLFGGQGASGLMRADTWLYELGRWRRWSRWLGRQPARRCGHAMAFDEGTGQTVLFGGVDLFRRSLGDTWLFDGSAWRRAHGPGPPARRYAAFAYAPDLGGCVLHGGAADEAGRQSFGDAWGFRDGRWARLPRGFHTAPRDDHGLAYHRAADRLVILGGLAGDPDVRVASPEGWEPAFAESPPPRHQCSPLAWDDQLGGLVMHGGEAGHGGPQFNATRVLRVAGE